MDDIIMNAIDPVDAMIQTKDKLKENNTCKPDVNENLRNRSTYFGNDI
jgi:hypothetical protein